MRRDTGPIEAVSQQGLGPQSYSHKELGSANQSELGGGFVPGVSST